MDDEKRFEIIEDRLAKHGRELDALRVEREHDSVVLSQVNATCLEIKHRMDELQDKPAKRWDSMLSSLLNAAALAILAYVLAKLGLS